VKTIDELAARRAQREASPPLFPTVHAKREPECSIERILRPVRALKARHTGNEPEPEEIYKCFAAAAKRLPQPICTSPAEQSADRSESGNSRVHSCT
jgi:hypothetical protein